MNPYDFYYLKDFLSFSPFSPNHAHFSMVSEYGFDQQEYALLSPLYWYRRNPPLLITKKSILCFLMVWSPEAQWWHLCRWSKRGVVDTTTVVNLNPRGEASLFLSF
jgi:hypothetical protein